MAIPAPKIVRANMVVKRIFAIVCIKAVPNIKLSQLFHTDHFEEIAPEMDPNPEYWPENYSELKKYQNYLKKEIKMQ